MDCKMCGGAALPFGQGVILGKYDIVYYCCPACGFVQTEQPYWLAEAYHSPIADEDTGLVARNLRFAAFTEKLLTGCLGAGRCLDWGGGYGLFVRLMRDKGFDFLWHDPFCPNLFARGHEGDPAGCYQLVTVCEVFEHFTRPHKDISDLLNLAPNVLFTTELIPQPPPPPAEWHYFAPASGQHISFFSLTSLARFAAANNLRLFSDGATVHLFSRTALKPPGLVPVV